MPTDLRNVRGLGASGAGTSHHIRQRVSALALVFLVPWFLYSIISMVRADYASALAWVAQPINAILLVLTISAALYHMRLGMQTVIEDYIAKTGTKQALLILNTFAAAALFVAAVLSVLRIWMSAGA